MQENKSDGFEIFEVLEIIWRLRFFILAGFAIGLINFSIFYFMPKETSFESTIDLKIEINKKTNGQSAFHEMAAFTTSKEAKIQIFRKIESKNPEFFNLSSPNIKIDEQTFIRDEMGISRIRLIDDPNSEDVKLSMLLPGKLRFSDAQTVTEAYKEVIKDKNMIRLNKFLKEKESAKPDKELDFIKKQFELKMQFFTLSFELYNRAEDAKIPINDYLNAFGQNSQSPAFELDRSLRVLSALHSKGAISNSERDFFFEKIVSLNQKSIPESTLQFKREPGLVIWPEPSGEEAAQFSTFNSVVKSEKFSPKLPFVAFIAVSLGVTLIGICLQFWKNNRDKFSKVFVKSNHV